MNLYLLTLPLVGGGIIGTLILINLTYNKTFLPNKPYTSNISLWHPNPPKTKKYSGIWAKCLSKPNEEDCIKAIVASHKLQKSGWWKLPKIN